MPTMAHIVGISALSAGSRKVESIALRSEEIACVWPRYLIE